MTQELLEKAKQNLKEKHYNLALANYEKYLHTHPNDEYVNYKVGLIYFDAYSNYPKALEFFLKAHSVDPKLPEINYHIGYILSRTRYYKLCLSYFEDELKLGTHIKALYSLGFAHKCLGNIEEAFKLIYEAHQLLPENQKFLAELVLMAYTHGFSQQTCKALVNKYQEITYKRIANLPFNNHNFKNHDFSKDKILKIAFISPAFSNNASMSMVEYWLSELIEAIDHKKFSVYCYHIGSTEDSGTEFYKKISNFKNLSGLTLTEVANQIFQDSIDIILDFATFTLDSCFEILALKPAPIQISWIAHLSSGLKEIEYLFTTPDMFSDEEKRYASEEVIEFDSVFYKPRVELPAMQEPPFIKNGYISFGCFNRFEKVSISILILWAEILSQTDNSIIMIHGLALKDPTVCDEIWDIFQAKGVEKTRVILEERKDSQEYYESYNQIDIALDTYPYQGGYTTLDAFCMGKPVISRLGETFFTRMILGPFRHIKDPKFINACVANSDAEYVSKAVAMANNIELISECHSFREQILNSPLADINKFIKGFEEKLREIWWR